MSGAIGCPIIRAGEIWPTLSAGGLGSKTPGETGDPGPLEFPTIYAVEVCSS